jgi:hypothetical protein
MRPHPRSRRSAALGLVVTAVAGTAGALAAAPRPVRVPDVGGVGVLMGYARASRAGLAVTLTGSPFDVGYGSCPPVIARQTPEAGTRTRRGRLRLSLTRNVPCAVESPAAPDPVPVATMPDFQGLRLDLVPRWAGERHQLWRVRNLPLVHAGRHTTLLKNFHVVAQDPPAGTAVTPGHPSDGGWVPTPVTVRAVQG